MKKGRIISLLLVAVMAVGLLPNAALAEGDRSIMRGVTGISGRQVDSIYFSTWNSEPLKWRVLDTKTNTGAKGLFLLSDVLLGTGDLGDVYFDNTYPYSNEWQKSDAKTWCADFYKNNFDAGEQNAVLATTKTDEQFTSTQAKYVYAKSENILDGDKVFFLSAEEAENGNYGFNDNSARVANYGNSAWVWWLRSPLADYFDEAGVVLDSGSVDISVVEYDVNLGWAARPAFNLNLNSVLFTSAAVGGKSTAEADGKIIEIPTPETAPKEWKATLADEAHKGFAVTQVEKTEEKKYTVTYSGAMTTTINPSEWISVMIADATGAYTHYGRIAQPTDATGTVELDLTKITLPQNAKIYLFNEQCNAEKMTDYASQLWDLFPAAAGEGTAPTCGLTITQAPQDQTVEVGKRATFTVKAFGSNLTYQWYINRNDELGWQKIHGATSDVYITSEVNLRNDGYLYFCEVTDEHGDSVQSDSATLYVVKTLIPPKTGDNHPIGLWMALCLVSAAGMLAVSRIDRRKRAR